MKNNDERIRRMYEVNKMKLQRGRINKEKKKI